MSILPTFIEKNLKLYIQDPPLEYGINFETGQLTGEMVSGIEAIKVWIWICLKVERFRYPAYSWDYGSELEQYIGKSYSDEFIKFDVPRAVEEALRINPHIKGIKDFNAEIEAEKLIMEFTVVTDMGEAKIKV